MTRAPTVATPGSSAPRRRYLHRLASLGGALLALALLWCGGLVWFANSIPEVEEDAAGNTDAIVVLTGGSQRLQSGLQLLAEGRGKKLFVSGVYRSTDVSALLHAAPPSLEALQCCIVLGHDAENTVGNAIETSLWMNRENYRSLRLVTANYHMRRALLEFSRAMPGTRIVPHPVFPEGMRREPWWAWPSTLELIVGEYDKYLLALARPFIPFDLGREEPAA
jgi:uncharacterized SAM-binding protein YcdF (DUF218 family)